MIGELFLQYNIAFALVFGTCSSENDALVQNV